MTTVIAALEGDSSAEPVLRAATALAALMDGEVIGLHVSRSGPDQATEAAEVEGVRLREARGSPADEIVSAAVDPEVAALVVPIGRAQGRPRASGQTPLDAICRVRKPVVVVPFNAHPAMYIRRVLVPVEGDGQRSQALEETLALVREHAVEVLALHVLSPEGLPVFLDHEPHATQVWEEEFLTRHLTGPFERLTFVRRLGGPAAEIVGVSREVDADLVILAWNQNLAPGRAKVVSETLANSSVPVLLLPTGTRSEGEDSG